MSPPKNSLYIQPGQPGDWLAHQGRPAPSTGQDSCSLPHAQLDPRCLHSQGLADVVSTFHPIRISASEPARLDQQESLGIPSLQRLREQNDFWHRNCPAAQSRDQGEEKEAKVLGQIKHNQVFSKKKRRKNSNCQEIQKHECFVGFIKTLLLLPHVLPMKNQYQVERNYLGCSVSIFDLKNKQKKLNPAFVFLVPNSYNNNNNNNKISKRDFFVCENIQQKDPWGK